MTIRYLKSMAELLAEFPEAVFNEYGELVVQGVSHIPANAFRFLGKEAHGEWNSQYLRPLAPKRKALAYGNRTGTVEFVVEGTEDQKIIDSSARWTRMPSFDIEERE